MEMMNSAAGGTVMGYADSVDSSPRSRGGESWDEPFPSSAAAAVSKLRLMCSYGGRIVPRPMDRSLCYLGGDTRIVVVERHTTLADLSAKLSRNLLGSCSFTLKYQLPNEDLDSLISVTNDEDLDIMIDEYDRIVASASAGAGAGSSRSSRLRLFLFPSKQDSTPSSIGSLLDDSKSESWFVDALNGAIGMDSLPRGLSSESTSVNCLLGLEDDSLKSRSALSAPAAISSGTAQPDPDQLLLPRPDSSGKLTRHDLQSVPDSSMVETASSFGSTSSAPYLSNLPPIRVHPDDRSQEQRMAGLEDHFSQMSISMATPAAPVQRLSDDGGFKDPNFPFHHPAPPNSASISTISPTENPTRINFSADDERPDQVVICKPSPPQQQLPLPLQQKPNPMDSTSLETIARPMFYHDRVASNTTAMNPIADPKRDVPVSSYVLTSMPSVEQQFRQHPSHLHQLQQQQQQPQPQFISANPNPQYIHHPATGTVLQFPAFYQLPVQQSQQSHPFDPQQFPVYYLPVRQNPGPQYNMPIATPLTDASTQVKPSATAFSKPIPGKSETNLYRMAAMMPSNAVSQQQLQPLVHLASDQGHPYSAPGYHVMHHHHPSQLQPNSATGVPTNYGYEFATDPAGNSSVFFTQTTSPPGMPPTQYQVTSPDTVSVASAAASLQQVEIKQTRAS